MSLTLALPRRPAAFTILESLVMLGLIAIMTVLILSLVRRQFRAEGDESSGQPAPTADVSNVEKSS